MADKSLDQQTRKIDKTQVNRGNEFEMMQKAQNQFMAIQAERKQNLAQQRAIMGMEQQQNMTLMQGAQMAAMGGGGGGIPQSVDPRTQAVMSKYGMGKPKFQRSQQHSQQVTKQNVVIHNTTNNNTTNNVNAGGYGGPVAGRALAFRGGGNESTEKFKVWLNNSYARQQQQAEIRNREYEKREDSLIRSSNKMMRKLEGIGKSIGKVLDPKKVGATLVNPLKMLFMFMGFHMFINNWKKLISWLSKGEKFFAGMAETFGFGYEDGNVKVNKRKLSSQVDKKLGWIGTQLVYAFGGNPYRGDRIGDMLHHIIIGDKQHYGLWEQIKDYLKDKFNERSEAIKNFPRPNLSSYIEGKNGKPDFIGAGGELIGYLTDILGIALTGSQALKRINYNNYKQADINSYKGQDDVNDVNRYEGIHYAKANGTAVKAKAEEFEKKIDWTKLNYYSPAEGKSSYEQGNMTLKEFLGEDKINYLKGLGLNVNENNKAYNLRTFFNKGPEDEIYHYTIPMSDNEGNLFHITFDNHGKVWEKSIYGNNHLLDDYYTGDLIRWTNNDKKFLKGVELSDLEISPDNSLSTATGVFRQFYELSKVVKTAQKGGEIDETKFAFGLDRINKYANEVESDGFLIIPPEALKTVLNLSNEEISNYTSQGNIKTKTYYSVVRNITFGEALKIARTQSNELKAFYEYVNTYIYTYGDIGKITALKDYAPSWKTVLGAALTTQSQSKITKRALARIEKEGAMRGLKKEVIERAERQAAKRIAGKFAAKAFARAIPYVGWALLAWDAIDLIYTFAIKRSPTGAALKEWAGANDQLKKNPKKIGDILDEDEYNIMMDCDEEGESKAKIFGIKLVNSVTGNEIKNGDKSAAEIKLTAIKVELFKKILKEKVGINERMDLKDIQTSDEFKESGEKDFSRAAIEHLHKQSGDNDFTFTKDGTVTTEFLASISGENSQLSKNEKKNEARRDNHRKQQENSNWLNAEMAKADRGLADQLGVTEFLKKGSNASQDDRIAYLKEQLYQAGIQDETTQNAIIGNLLSESGLNPASNEKDGAGVGIAQWTDGGRKAAVLNYINDKRKAAGLQPYNSIDEATYEEQVAALLFNPKDGLVGSKFGKDIIAEMEKKDKDGKMALDLEGRTTVFMDKFESPVYSSKHNKDNPNEKAWSYKKDKNGKYILDENGQKVKIFYDSSRNEEIARRLGNSNTAAGVGGHQNLYAAELLASGAEAGANGINYVINKTSESDIIDKIKGGVNTVGNKAGELVDRVADALPNIEEKKYPLGLMGKEYSDYYYYKANNGSLPPNLTRAQWNEAIHRRTGFYPSELGHLIGKANIVSEASTTPTGQRTVGDDFNNPIITAQLKARQEEEERIAKEEKEKEELKEKQQAQLVADIHYIREYIPYIPQIEAKIKDKRDGADGLLHKST